MTDLSVVLPVHAAADPTHFAQSLASLAAQSRPADEIVVVVDGPVSGRHEEALERASESMPIVVERLAVNAGPGVANQAGLRRARGEWIAKADADDVSDPARFARQLERLQRGGADVCGTAMRVFVDEGPRRRVVALREAPATHEAVLRRLRYNNPISHPTVMYRRTSALAVGGYPPQRYMEDYVLVVRLAARGAGVMNLAEPLVWFRANNLASRRRAPEHLRLDLALQRLLLEEGLTTRSHAVAAVAARQGYRMLPRPVMTWADRRLLGRRVSPPS